MLIESKTSGVKRRAIRFQLGCFMTACGELVPAQDCLVLAENIWWDFDKVIIETSEMWKNVGVQIPEFPGETKHVITRVLLKPMKLNICNLRPYCITPL